MTEQPASFEETGEETCRVGRDQSEPSVLDARQSVVQVQPSTILQDLIDLPRQVLPAETYRHLQNATRETALTFYSFWRNFNKILSDDSGQKVRKRIDIE